MVRTAHAGAVVTSLSWFISTEKLSAFWRRDPPRHAHGDLTSLAPHERLSGGGAVKFTQEESPSEYHKSIYFFLL